MRSITSVCDRTAFMGVDGGTVGARAVRGVKKSKGALELCQRILQHCERTRAAAEHARADDEHVGHGFFTGLFQNEVLISQCVRRRLQNHVVELSLLLNHLTRHSSFLVALTILLFLALLEGSTRRMHSHHSHHAGVHIHRMRTPVVRHTDCILYTHAAHARTSPELRP